LGHLRFVLAYLLKNVGFLDAFESPRPLHLSHPGSPDSLAGGRREFGSSRRGMLQGGATARLTESGACTGVC
jgi:hypothetical protein